MDPLEAFLLHTHKGHCEFFASAMVLSLRAQHIPARVVTGYFTNEWSPETRSFIVRQSDAHAWCEAWLDGLGWVTVDPTPPIYRGRAGMSYYQPPLLKRLAEQMRAFWQNNILDYSNTAKAEFIARLSRRPLTEQLVQVNQWIQRVMNNRSSAAVTPSGSDRFRWLRWVAAPEVRNPLLVLLLVSWLGYRRFYRRHHGPLAIASPISFMNQLLSRLESKGWKREPGQTPGELVRMVEQQTDGRLRLAPALELYHRCRFAGEVPTAEEAAGISRLLHEIETWSVKR